MKRIVVLGSTGSIGVNTLKVVADHPKEFQVIGLAAHSNAQLLSQQVRQFRPKFVALQDAARYRELQSSLNGSRCKVLVGQDGVAEVAAAPGADCVVVGITGAAALKPTLAAIAKGRAIGLANKETLVMAGELVIQQAKSHKAQIIPIDSEHSAIFQCLQGHRLSQVRRILLTTSGGPLKDIPFKDFHKLTKQQVMNHPRWKMGPKITVDSATMMNKALEVIEAHWLFGMPVDRIEILVHPEAIIHSLVEFIDGALLAQLGITDMRIPIQYALTYPGRLSSSWPALDLVGIGRLTFEAPNRQKFPCLNFGFEAARKGGTFPAVLNAANEACVRAFLEDGLSFVEIPSLIEGVLRRHKNHPNPTLEDILQADAWAHTEVHKRIEKVTA